MNRSEANVFLIGVALIDPRMSRVDESDQAAMARAWALHLPEIPLDVAQEAGVRHYRSTRESITVADVVSLAAAILRERAWAEQENQRAVEAARPAPPDRARLAELFPDLVHVPTDEDLLE